MTTRTMERARTKCGQYWPELEGRWSWQAESKILMDYIIQAPVCSAECLVWLQRTSRTTRTSWWRTSSCPTLGLGRRGEVMRVRYQLMWSCFSFQICLSFSIHILAWLRHTWQCTQHAPIFAGDQLWDISWQSKQNVLNGKCTMNINE